MSERTQDYVPNLLCEHLSCTMQVEHVLPRKCAKEMCVVVVSPLSHCVQSRPHLRPLVIRLCTVYGETCLAYTCGSRAVEQGGIFSNTHAKDLTTDGYSGVSMKNNCVCACVSVSVSMSMSINMSE